jgi:L-histidine N-alpha-methyltransferase
MTDDTAVSIRVDVYVTEADLDAALEEDVRLGLAAQPKSLPPVWFYDETGCDLFDRITRLPEYYPTRAERAILAARSDAIADAAGCDTLVELGSGTSEKTRLLLDAMTVRGLERFVAFDISEPTLRDACAALSTEYPGLALHAVAGDFHRHLDKIPTGGSRLVAFLGGTIGNFAPEQRHKFLSELAVTFGPNDRFLLGVDLVKDPARLVAAYDDDAGVTAAFNRNVLSVLNRRVGADFDPAQFEHMARWNESEEWIEMRLRSRRPQEVRLEALGFGVSFAEDEDLLTEISAKFTPERIGRELREVGLHVEQSWTDPDGDFLLVLASPRAWRG